MTRKIKTIAAGYAQVPGDETTPDIELIRDGRTWYAFYQGSARLHNFHAGYTVTGGARTRLEALESLEPGCWK